MIEALDRLNASEAMLDNIQALYEHSMFRVVTREETSEYKQQISGIRQGCPLSPYLLILVMTVIFADIHDRINDKLPRPQTGIIDGLDFTKFFKHRRHIIGSEI